MNGENISEKNTDKILLDSAYRIIQQLEGIQKALDISNKFAIANNSMLPDDVRKIALAQACSLQGIDINKIGMSHPESEKLPVKGIIV